MNTQDYQRTVKFKDDNNNFVIAEIEVTHRNGYPEFTMSGEYEGAHGQVFDRVKPAKTSQRELIELWNKWHMEQINDLGSFVKNLDALLDDIEDEQISKQVTEEDSEYFELFDEPETVHALSLMLDLTIEDIDTIEEEGDNRFSIGGMEYLCGTGEEMDVLWDKELDRCLEEIVYPDLPDYMQIYFDDEAWKRDARIDGRAHILNRYDGSELKYKLNDVWYFAYKQ
jgi:hypothetical protein